MIKTFSQFPLDVKYGDCFDECPVCLEPADSIEVCVLTPCRHRFCEPCALALAGACALCMRSLDRSNIVTLRLSGKDKIWLTANVDDQTVAEAFRPLRLFFGSINLLSGNSFYSKNPFRNVSNEPLVDHVGTELRALIGSCAANVRGITEHVFRSRILLSIINAILITNGRVRTLALCEFVCERWELDVQAVLAALLKLRAGGYLIRRGAFAEYQA